MKIDSALAKPPNRSRDCVMSKFLADEMEGIFITAKKETDYRMHLRRDVRNNFFVLSAHQSGWEPHVGGNEISLKVNVRHFFFCFYHRRKNIEVVKMIARDGDSVIGQQRRRQCCGRLQIRNILRLFQCHFFSFLPWKINCSKKSLASTLNDNVLVCRLPFLSLNFIVFFIGSIFLSFNLLL